MRNGAGAFELVNPSTELDVGYLLFSTDREIAKALSAAADAYGFWSGTSVEERAYLLDGFAAGIESRRDDLALTLISELGTPASQIVELQITPAIAAFRTQAQLLRDGALEDPFGRPVMRKALGPAACIAPWNYPLYQNAVKIASALGAGCPVVAKPSPVAASATSVFQSIARDLGLPGGAFTLLQGGRSLGEALVDAEEIAIISFTGSSAIGAVIAAQAGRRLCPCVLELGGKSASLVMPGADLYFAVAATMAKAFQNSGQTCAALTRLLVPIAELPEAEALAESEASKFRPGDPTDPNTNLGPVATNTQFERINDIIDQAMQQGCRLIAGGSGRPPGIERGFFSRPTVLSSVDPDVTAAQEEIFGPVLTIIPYRSIDEAIAIANDTPYGLSAALFGPQEERVALTALANRLFAGSISINGARTDHSLPFGGFRGSGYGRERGLEGLLSFTSTQAIHG